MNDNKIINIDTDTDTISEPNCFLYEASENLIQNIDNEIISDLFNTVSICGYQIIDKAQNPFLQFLLTNDKPQNCLNFPSFNILTISEEILLSNTKDLLTYINSFLKKLFDKSEIQQFMGFYLEIKTKTIYVFYDFSECDFNQSLIYSSNTKYWFALVDEIINKQFVCSLPICNKLAYFFLSKHQFITLINNNGNKYEHPTVCYVEKDVAILNFTYFFGIQKMEKGSFLGPYYYFTTYENALKKCCSKMNQNSEKFGIIRVAVFLGKMLVKLNYPEDSIDNSNIKREKLHGSIKEQLTMRITDYDGLWSYNYDSCFVGKIKLDNGDILQDMPIFSVKKYEQHYPLSYHFVNNKFDSII